MTNRTIIILLFLALMSAAGFGQIPRTISYQGIARHHDSTLVSDGTHTVRIFLFERPTGSVLVFYEVQKVETKNGIFKLNIGEVTPINDSILFNRQYYLGITVDGEGYDSLHTALTSVPYSLNARTSGALSDIATIPSTVFSKIFSYAAGGDLSGDYPNLTVAGIQGRPIAPAHPDSGATLTYDGTQWTPKAPKRPASFSVTNVADQFVGLNNPIVFDNKIESGSFDAGNNFSLAANSYSAPTDGRYHFFLDAVFPFSFDSVRATITVNGVAVYSEFFRNTDVEKTVDLSIHSYPPVFTLKAGDKIKCLLGGFISSSAILISAPRFSGYREN